METLQHLFQYLVHIDEYLLNFVATYGIWTYVVLFLIIFCETGLVVTPFLPGDSLLFAAGSIASTNDILDIQLLFILLVLASIFGNKINYFIGRLIGPKVFNTQSVFLNRKHLLNAHDFYEKHGGKTIIFARFLPILRTFAPFVAGVGYMSAKRFTIYNIISGIAWIGSMLAAGYYFGSIPFIQENFSLVIYAVIAISLLPPVFVFIYHRIYS